MLHIRGHWVFIEQLAMDGGRVAGCQELGVSTFWVLNRGQIRWKADSLTPKEAKDHVIALAQKLNQ